MNADSPALAAKETHAERLSCAIDRVQSLADDIACLLDEIRGDNSPVKDRPEVGSWPLKTALSETPDILSDIVTSGRDRLSEIRSILFNR